MKKLNKIKSAIAVTIAASAIYLFAGQSPKTPLAPLEVENSDPLNGIVYYKNPVTGKLALYISFELEPNHEYDVQVTDDAVTWSEPFHISTKGNVNDVYYSFNVDPCAPGGSIWPRVINQGISP
jgi:hypothetical protein